MRLFTALLALVALGACSNDGGAADTTAPSGPPGSSAVQPPPGPDSPFCDAVAAMAAELDSDDPPADVDAFLADAYGELLAVAPAELAPHIEALIAALDGAAPAGTTAALDNAAAPADVAPDDVAPDDVAPSIVIVTATERLADYVAENCGRIEANPGPPPTPPAGGFDTVADSTPATATD